MSTRFLKAATIAALSLTLVGTTGTLLTASANGPVNHPTTTVPVTAETTATPITTEVVGETKPSGPVAVKPVIAAKPTAKKTVKVLSVKSFKHGRYVFVDDYKPYFKDMKLKHQLGKTKKNDNTSYKVLKQAKLKVNGKKATYLQIKTSKHRTVWINQHHVLEILR